MQLKKQRLLVIGGTSGFGMAIARQALQEGADVHIIGSYGGARNSCHHPIRPIRPFDWNGVRRTKSGATKNFFCSSARI